MIERYYTVEKISEMLSMHPKTIQRYIREGKLPASKVGKGWRITGHDLSVFIEANKGDRSLRGPGEVHSIEDRVTVSSVVDIFVHDKNEAIRIINTLSATMNAKPPEIGRSSMHTQHIIEENKVRITLWGGIRFMDVMISAINALTEQLED
jgi:excisionase family DNA binding protein